MTALRDFQQQRLEAELAALEADYRAALERWKELRPAIVIRKIEGLRRTLSGQTGRGRHSRKESVNL